MKKIFSYIAIGFFQFFNHSHAQTLTSTYCNALNDGKILQPLLEKLDATLNYIPKISQENIEALKTQESIITTLKLKRGNVDTTRINQEYNNLQNMKYYQQWEYINQLNKIKREINYILELETNKSKTAWLEGNPYYKKNQKIDVNVLGLDLAIDANKQFSEFEFTYFNRNKSSSKIFNDVDFSDYEMTFKGPSGVKYSFEKYMHCKLARIAENK